LLENQLKVSEDICIGEDALCLYPTLLDADVLVVLEQPYYHYRQRADSLIKTLRTIELSKMESVYNDLKKIFNDKGVLDIMLPQLQYYLLSLLTINTEGPNLGDTINLYPFDEVKYKDNLVIYGGGTFGQHLYKKITNNTAPLSNAGWQQFIGGCIMFVISAFTEKHHAIDWQHSDVIAAYFYLVIVGSVMAYTFYLYTLRNLPIGIVTIYAYINPIVAIIIGTVFLKEAFNWNIPIAVALIISGIICVNWGYKAIKKNAQ
jgi:multidrug transporter EmrE-like cation transporter